MGLFDRFLGKRSNEVQVSHPNAPVKFSVGPILGIPEFLPVLGFNEQTISRREAMTVSAVIKGRNMICGEISSLPLLVWRVADNEVVDNPLLRQIDPDVPNVTTISMTIEDLLFQGESWWLVLARDFDGYPTSATHLDPFSVATVPPPGYYPQPLPSGIDPREAAVVWVNGRPTAARDVIRFDSPNGAILKDGASVIRRAILLDRTSKLYASDPRPLDYFTIAPGSENLDDDEIEQIVRKWITARQQRSTAVIPESLVYNSVSFPSPVELQLVELQKQSMLECGHLFGLEPEDMGISLGKSQTYRNAVDKRRDRINGILAVYMRALTDRLSMPDVTRRGYQVRFDLDDYLKADPLSRAQIQQTYVAMGVLSAQEVRDQEGISGTVPPKPEPSATPPALPAGQPPEVQQ